MVVVGSIAVLLVVTEIVDGLIAPKRNEVLVLVAVVEAAVHRAHCHL